MGTPHHMRTTKFSPTLSSKLSSRHCNEFDFLCLWIEQIPDGLVTLDMNLFGRYFQSLTKTVRVQEIQKLITNLDDVRYCTLNALVSLFYNIYSSTYSLDVLLQLAEVGICIFRNVEIISIHVMIILICNFKVVFTKYPIKGFVPHIPELTQFLIDSSVDLLFDSTEIDNSYTVDNSKWTHTYSLNRYYRQLSGSELKYNVLTPNDIEIISDLSLESLMKVLRARRGKEWANYDSVKKGGRKLSPGKILRESVNAKMILDEWRLQWKNKYGSLPSKEEEVKSLKEWHELNGAINMRLNDFRKIFAVYQLDEKFNIIL